MKKTLIFLLVALLILGGGLVSSHATLAAEDEFKTLGDVFPYVPDGAPLFENVCICVFEKEGTFYRVEADVPAEIIEKIDALYDSESYDSQVKELLKDLPVKQTIDLSAFLLKEGELEALVGKTGQELTDMGFVPADEYEFSDTVTEIHLYRNAFEYVVSFAETVSPQRAPNLEEVMAPLTVKHAAFTGNLSYYAWEPAFDPEGGPEYWYEAPPSFPIPEIPVDESPFRTLADVYAALADRYSISGPTDGLIVFAFETADGRLYRVEAQISAEIQEQLDAIDFFDEERDQKQQELLGPLPVSRVGDISACMPAQAELDALVGKTGQELMDMGFEQGMGYSFWDKAEFYLEKDLFEYHVYFNEKVPEMEDYDAVLNEILASLTVDKAEISGLSNVCSDPNLIW